ncbi:MAG: hypothetical protein KIT56_11155, partial [Gammaproteobacteria bacterium]|nr:hypothetical protein [Gammaproteobacteria bacterium]
MRKIIRLLLFILVTTIPYSTYAILSMELTRGVAGAIPIAVVPFAVQGSTPQDISGIIANDLQNSGRFKVVGKNLLSEFPSTADKASTEYFRKLGTDSVVVGRTISLGGDRFQVNFQLLDMFRGKGAASVVIDKNYTVPGSDMRKLAHHISDLIYEQITGTRGVFSTKIDYVVV